MYCLNCDRLISNQEKFCPYCGAENPNYSGVKSKEAEFRSAGLSAENLEATLNAQDDKLGEFEPQGEKENSPLYVQAEEDVQTDISAEELSQRLSTKPTDSELADFNRTSIKAQALDTSTILSEAHHQPHVNQNSPEQQLDNQIKHSSESKQKNKKVLPLVLSLTGILLLTILLFLFIPEKPETININDYISIEWNGLDSIGKAQLRLNEKKLLADYGELLQKNAEYQREGTSRALRKINRLFSPEEQIADKQIARKFFDDVVQYQWDKNDNLQNGDQITLVLTVDEAKAAQIWFVNLQYENVKETVKDLAKADTIDAFEQIEITFSGYNKEAEVSYTKKSDYNLPSDITFVFSPDSHLKNGDKVEVRLESKKGDVDQYLLTELGVQLLQERKTYTVSGLEDEPIVTETETQEVPTEQSGEETVGNQEEYTDYYAGCLFPYSSEVLIDEYLISNLSDWEINSAINEIYARYGYIFDEPEISAYYHQFDWYVERIPEYSFDSSVFNAIEAENIDRLARERNLR